jgi:hypothetical protein
MTSDNAIPITTTGDVTRLYFDGGSVFGAPHARPSITWDDEQLLDAAHVGAAGRDLHPDLVAALCARYVDMAQAELEIPTAVARVRTAERQLAAAQGVAAGLQRELEGCRIALDEERNAHQGTMFARELAEDLYVAEMAERNRVAALHAEVSAHAAWLQRQVAQLGAEALNLRHQLAGTTPVSVAIALARSVEPDADDTTVMHLEDLHQAEVCCG